MKHQTKEEKELEQLIKEARELLAVPTTVSANRYRKALVKVIDKYESNTIANSELEAKINEIHDRILSGALPNNFEEIKEDDGVGFKTRDFTDGEEVRRSIWGVPEYQEGPSGWTYTQGWPEKPKPPIEIMPKSICQEKRLKDLKQAIISCIEADFPVPNEWFAERTELLTIFKNQKK